MILPRLSLALFSQSPEHQAFDSLAPQPSYIDVALACRPAWARAKGPSHPQGGAQNLELPGTPAAEAGSLSQRLLCRSSLGLPNWAFSQGDSLSRTTFCCNPLGKKEI